MKLSLVERETILLYNQAEPMAEIYTHVFNRSPLFVKEADTKIAHSGSVDNGSPDNILSFF